MDEEILYQPVSVQIPWVGGLKGVNWSNAR